MDVIDIADFIANLDSGLIMVLSEPGTGKTSLIGHLVESIYYNAGQERLNLCRQKLTELNKNRAEPFEFPEQVPIYTPRDFKLRFQIDYETYYEPYLLSPYYLGLTNDKLDTQYLLPYSVIGLPELQKYTNSRKGASLPEPFHRTFEIHRHWHLLFITDGHRGSFIDLRVRALTRLILEIQEQIHERDEMGRIIQTTWNCRAFHSVRDYEDYIDHNAETYTEVTTTHKYDIFDDYDSFGCSEEFEPPAGKTFSMLPRLSQAEINKLPPETAKFYAMGEPAGFRGSSSGSKKDTKKNDG